MWKLSIKKINEIGYTGAAIYKVWFDDGARFYIGSCLCVRDKIDRIRERFRKGTISKKMKLFIKDKTKASFEVLERVDDTSKLLEREDFYIKKNACDSGMLNRIKNSYGKGIKWTTKEMSANNKRLDIYRRMPRSEAHKVAIRKTTREKTGKSVNQYDRYGNFVVTFSCPGIAAEQTGFPLNQIQKSMYGTLKFVRGYAFICADRKQSLPVLKPHHRPPSKKIKQFDINGNFIKEHRTSLDAAKEFGIHRSAIVAACNGNQKTAGGFMFRHSAKCGNSIEPLTYHDKYEKTNPKAIKKLKGSYISSKNNNTLTIKFV